MNSSMPREPRRGAESYDEITRRTVPEPDSSFRPTPLQEKQAYEGTRILSDDEQRLHARVAAALSGVPGAEHVEIEIDRETVTLRGQISDPSLFDRIEQCVRGIDGVTAVVDQLVVAPAGSP
jgi:HSP20 family molecular chaperone IbpA